MIPKVIHYCWFGGNPLNKLANKCIRSWKKYCPNFEIIEWNEDNFDISHAPLYVQEAYQNGKWAFVTDYVRLSVLYDNGGIYLDTDVELIAPIYDLLDYPAFFGFQKNREVNTGLGCGCEKGSQIISEMMDDYSEISFIKEDGSFDVTPCPERSLHVFQKYGLVADETRQILSNGSIVFEPEVLCPINHITLEKEITPNTVAIHWFSASWHPQKRFAVRAVRWSLGEEKYRKIKAKKKRIKKVINKRKS